MLINLPKSGVIVSRQSPNKKKESDSPKKPAFSNLAAAGKQKEEVDVNQIQEFTSKHPIHNINFFKSRKTRLARTKV